MKIEHDFGNVRVIVGEPSPNHMRIEPTVMDEPNHTPVVIHINEWSRMKALVDKMFKTVQELA